MRTRKWSIGVVVLVTVAGWGSYAWADTAVAVDPAAITHTGIDHEISLGWRFYVDKTITITHLGLFDSSDAFGGSQQNGPGLLGTHTVAIWRLPKEGGFDEKLRVTIGPGAELSDNHAWVPLAQPVKINPDPVPYVVVDPKTGVQTEYYERWMVGVWTPNYLYGLPSGTVGDALMFSQEAVTFDIVNADIIRFDGYTKYPYPAETFAIPWPAINSGDHYGVNFKYTLHPTANAGLDLPIYTSQQISTVIHGAGTGGTGASLSYKWLEGDTVLFGPTPVGANGEANLGLSGVSPALSIGSHDLTLEVTHGTLTGSDTMVLTISNTPPEAVPAPTYQVVGPSVSLVILSGEVADFDGDALSCKWVVDGVSEDPVTLTPPAGGTSVATADLDMIASELSEGLHEVLLVVNDGVNPDVSATARIMVDRTLPTLAPIPDIAMLWPPNHTLRTVRILANAGDNLSTPVTLTAAVQSSEPDDGSPEQDCYVESVSSATGEIVVQLRAERSGSGGGRVYTVTITATDEVGNQSTATVDIRVPHDQRKK